MYVQWLQEKIKQNNWGKREFMFWKDNGYDYAWLWQQLDFFTKKIETNQIESGRVCAIFGDYSPYSVALLLALIRNKNIIVPVSTAIEERRNYYGDTSQVEFIFEFNECGDFSIQKTGNSVSNQLLIVLQQLRSSGLVLYTSGSTGNPKADLYDFHILINQFRGFSKRAYIMEFCLLLALSALIFPHAICGNAKINHGLSRWKRF